MHLSPKASALVSSSLHQEALRRAENYKKCRSELIEVLIKIQQRGVYREHGCSSLFNYCVECLQLGKNVAAYLCQVSHKAEEYPEMRELIATGKLSVSNARRIAPKLTPETKDEWLEKAQVLSKPKLEEEIRKSGPGYWAIHISATRATEPLWNQAKEVVHQKIKRSPSRADVFNLALEALLEKEGVDYRPVFNNLCRTKKDKTERAQLLREVVGKRVN